LTALTKRGRGVFGGRSEGKVAVRGVCGPGSREGNLAERRPECSRLRLGEGGRGRRWRWGGDGRGGGNASETAGAAVEAGEVPTGCGGGGWGVRGGGGGGFFLGGAGGGGGGTWGCAREYSSEICSSVVSAAIHSTLCSGRPALAETAHRRGAGRKAERRFASTNMARHWPAQNGVLRLKKARQRENEKKRR